MILRIAQISPYFGLGWKLHPAHAVNNGICTCRKGEECEAKGKHPRSEHGVADATDDREKWKRWVERMRDINVQLACGEPSGVTVIDVDVKNNGLEEIEKLKRTHEFPQTPTARTGGGGLHYFYGFHPDVVTSNGELGPGIETKSTGTSVHLPPSVHESGRAYEWLVSPFEVEVAPMPEWIVEHFRRRQEMRASRSAQTSTMPDGIDIAEAIRRAEAWLVATPGAIQGKGGRIATFKAALALTRGFALDEGTAFRLMREIYNPRCEPPWSDRDLQEKVHQASTKSHLSLGYLYLKDRRPPQRKPARPTDEVVMAPQEDDPGDDDDRAPRVRSCQGLADAPVVDDAVVPRGWRMNGGGIFRFVMRQQTWVRVSSTPIVISAITRDPVDGSTFVRFSVRTRGVEGQMTWLQKMVGLDTLSAKSKIEKLSRYGCEITSWNARDIAEFVHDFIRVNQQCMPMAHAARHLGWQRAGGFFWGEKLIKGGHVIRVDDKDVTKWGKHAVIFSETEDSLAELSSCYKGRGHIGAWKDAIRDLASESAYLRIAVLASFAAPMLEVMARRGRHIQNFCVDFANTTSTGKTTLLRASSSVWGNPFDHDETTGLIASWGATKSFIERIAAVRNHLPLFLDDTKRARMGLVPEIVYMVANGHGDGRANITGVQEKRRFRTVLISTGEMRLVDFSEDGGTRGRTLQLWGAPFGSPTEDKARTIADVLARLQKNHGLAGPAFVRWLTMYPKTLDTWAKRFDAVLETFATRAGKTGALHRQAPIFALLELVETMLQRAELLPWERTGNSPVQAMYQQLREAAVEADRSLAAYDHLRSVVLSQRGRLYDGIHREEPMHGWLGKWEDGKNIFLYPHAVKRMLKEGGFEAPAVLKQWADGAVIKADTNQAARVTKMLGTATRMIEFPVARWLDEVEQEIPSSAVPQTEFKEDLFEGTPPADIEQASFDFTEVVDDIDPRTIDDMADFHAASEREIMNPVPQEREHGDDDDWVTEYEHHGS